MWAERRKGGVRVAVIQGPWHGRWLVSSGYALGWGIEQGGRAVEGRLCGLVSSGRGRGLWAPGKGEELTGEAGAGKEPGHGWGPQRVRAIRGHVSEGHMGQPKWGHP